MDVDRAPALIEQADPPEQGNETEDDGWADLAGRYGELTCPHFIRLPRPARAAAVRIRQERG